MAHDIIPFADNHVAFRAHNPMQLYGFVILDEEGNGKGAFIEVIHDGGSIDSFKVVFDGEGKENKRSFLVFMNPGQEIHINGTSKKLFERTFDRIYYLAKGTDEIMPEEPVLKANRLIEFLRWRCVIPVKTYHDIPAGKWHVEHIHNVYTLTHNDEIYVAVYSVNHGSAGADFAPWYHIGGFDIPEGSKITLSNTYTKDESHALVFGLY